MKGVRRLLGGGAQHQQTPPAFLAKDIPPSSVPVSILPIQPTAPLVLNKSTSSSHANANLSTAAKRPVGSSTSSTVDAALENRIGTLPHSYSKDQDLLDGQFRPQSQASDKSSSPSRSYSVPSPPSSPSSTLRSPNDIAQPAQHLAPVNPLPDRLTELKAWKRASAPIDTRDKLLISLLASEAIVDSRDCDILCSEDVEELKKELQVFHVRLDGLQKKLQLEKKIRDAAASLAKINASREDIAKQSSMRLELANRKVEQIQTDLFHVSERSYDIQRKLLEHRTAVLSFSLRSLETKYASNSDEPSNMLTLRNFQFSPTSSETSYSSTNTKFDGLHLFSGHENALQPSAARKPPSAVEHAVLEERLKEANEKLQMLTDAHDDSRREISMLKLELEGLETTHAFELQAMTEDLELMKEETDRFSTVETQLQEAIQERDALIEQGRFQQQELDILRHQLEILEKKTNEAANVGDCVLELETATRALKNLILDHDLNLLEDAPLTQHVTYLEAHLIDIRSSLDNYQSQQNKWESQKHELEECIRTGMDERKTLVLEIEEVRRDHENAKRNIQLLEERLNEQAAVRATSVIPLPESPSEQISLIIDALKPVWNALPSAESRASKFGLRTKPNGSAPSSPSVSLSELDVRLLKTLYDGKPAYQTADTPNQFTIGGFISRVQALIVDDRALIERLVRFAQAHDLLKQNSERAQRIAQESSVALETYQKQVKVLEDRNISLTANVNALQAEIQDLNEALDRILSEKRDVEIEAEEQAETCRQLAEANNALNAKALTLAAEVASAPEAVRAQLELQLAECKKELASAQEDLAAMRNAEASQNIALMDELNSMQSQNESLRAQLRALQAGKK